MSGLRRREFITLLGGAAVVLAAGDVTIEAFETPGHTMGTVSFVYDARDGGRTYRAFTVGGLGFNAIQSPEQVEA